MPSEEPSNAVLAAMLRSLEDRVRESDKAEAGFHERLEGRLDTLVRLIGDVNTKAVVNATRIEGEKARLDKHEKHHNEEEKASRHLGTIVIGVLTIGALVAGVLVSYFIH